MVANQAAPELVEQVEQVPQIVLESESGSLNNEHRRESQHIPVLMNQGQEAICWAYSSSMVLFRVFFRAVYLGYCNSSIQLGNSWLKNENSYLIFNNNESSSLISIINFILSTRAIIDVVLAPINQRVNANQKIIIYSQGKDYTINIKLNELRQCIVLSYIFLVFIGIELDYKHKAQHYGVYELMLQGTGRNTIRTIKQFINDVQDYERRTNITKFMTEFWFTKKSNAILLKYLYDLHFIPRISEKIENTLLKFIDYYHKFIFNNPSNNIDEMIAKIKLLFKEARKSRVYVLIACDVSDLVLDYRPIDSNDHSSHAVYAIPDPENKEQFIVKNSWGDQYNNIIVSFDDLRNWKFITIYVCYFNYFDYSKKTRRNYDLIFRDVGVASRDDATI